MRKLKFSFLSTLILSFCLAVPVSFANTPENQVKQLLSQNSAPAGVVFEIVTSSANSLDWILPKTQKLIKKLRAHFPKLEITIVTHGDEQFALKTTNNKKYKKVHSITQQLVKQNNIQLHVCGTYASMNNVEEEEFPDYVDVTAEGPATINDYITLGYVLIKM